MKYTLLEMVQDILSDMDSDEVNNIDDTVEAQQVAQIIKTCYFEMIGNRNWPHLKRMIQLEHANDITRPNYLTIPDNLKELVSFKYDKVKKDEERVRLDDVVFKYPDEFLRYVSNRNNTHANISEIIDTSGVSLLIRNDIAPSYWTTFDDTFIVTDSYDKSVDDTLQRSKTQCIAYLNPSWSRMNESIPNLPIEAFPALLEEAKSTAFASLKQMVNQKAEQKSVRQQRWLSRKAWRLEGGVRYEDYGRKGRR